MIGSKWFRDKTDACAHEAGKVRVTRSPPYGRNGLAARDRLIGGGVECRKARCLFDVGGLYFFSNLDIAR